MKRFWKSSTVEPFEDGHTILLDGRPVRTPAKRQIVVPSQTIAREIAAEWDAQEEQVAPLTMPMTRAASTCLDRVSPELGAVRDMIGAYGETDLLCYRADRPEALAARQRDGWDPVLEWVQDVFGVRPVLQVGVMHLSQPETVVAALRNAVADQSAWPLTALAELTTISGSLILALAVRHGHLTGDDAWRLSRIDEQWNIDQWGEDHEAAQQAARRRADFLHAAYLMALLEREDVP